MAIPNQIIISSSTNTVNVGSSNNSITVSSSFCNTLINVTQSTTNIVTVATPGPQGTTGAAGGGINTSSFATTGSNTFIGNQTITGSLNITQGITGSLLGTSSWANNSTTSSYVLSSSYALTSSYSNTSTSASYALNSTSASYALNSTSASFATTSITSSYVNDLNQNVIVSGSLTVLNGATIFGSSSFQYVTSSQLAVSASYISVNVFEPAQRFGGILVYDSGSSNATASLSWDSLNNHWVYQNASGSTYSGGMLMSGPRNTGSLGDEPSLTQYYIPRSDGGDHLDNTQIYSSGSIHIVTGSLTVTQGITGSLNGTSSWANNSTSASFSSTASYINNLSQSVIITGSTQGNVTTLSIASNTASLNLNLGNFFTLQLVSGSNTHINPSNIKPGQSSVLQLSTTGSATVSFPSTVKQPSGSAYTPTTTTGTDILTFVSFDSSNLYLVSVKNLI
jgi:hypothetical protein